MWVCKSKEQKHGVRVQSSRTAASVYCELWSEDIISKLQLQSSAWEANDCQAENLDLFLPSNYYTLSVLLKVTEKSLSHAVIFSHFLPFWISHPLWSEQTRRRQWQHSLQDQSRCCRWLSTCCQIVQNWSLARTPRERECLGDKDKQISLPALKHSERTIHCLWRALAHILLPL